MMRNFPVTVSAMILLGMIIAAACGPSSSDERLNFSEKGRTVPAFDADSAYRFVEEQLEFGPRNPGSEGHRLAKTWLIGKLGDYAGEGRVFPQHFRHRGYEGDTLELTNVIAAFNPNAGDRIMLCAHWDTRPRADRDSVAGRINVPIPGADDGASGVAVLLELARLFSENPPPLGVDLILFDGEDYGREGDLEQYFLGSRHWAQNPPVENYSPRFGILLDMVGGEGARFPKEKNSLRIAPALVNELWSIAEEKRFDDIFIPQEGSAIADDHMVIYRNSGIPTIDIIRHEPSDGSGSIRFAPYWHTQEDEIGVIDRRTLNAVGEVLSELVYNRVK